MTDTARLDFPVRSGKIFAALFFGILGVPALWMFLRILLTADFEASRGPGLVIFGIFLAMIAGGFLLTMVILGGRPTAMEARESGLVLFYGRREAAVAWTEVVGLTQVIIRGMATHVVRFRDGRSVPFGLGEKPQSFARWIARHAGLIWITEPFIAERRGL